MNSHFYIDAANASFLSHAIGHGMFLVDSYGSMDDTIIQVVAVNNHIGRGAVAAYFGDLPADQIWVAPSTGTLQ